MYGRALVRILRKKEYSVLAVLDNNASGNIDGIPIIKPKKAESDINVFVAIESEKLANQVIKQLKDMQHKGIIRSFDDVINNMNLKYRKDLLEWHKSNGK